MFSINISMVCYSLGLNQAVDIYFITFYYIITLLHYYIITLIFPWYAIALVLIKLWIFTLLHFNFIYTGNTGYRNGNFCPTVLQNPSLNNVHWLCDELNTQLPPSKRDEHVSPWLHVINNMQQLIICNSLSVVVVGTLRGKIFRPQQTPLLFLVAIKSPPLCHLLST